DFGNFAVVDVTGQVYNDLNGNGNNNGGTDPGLPGWTVLLLDAAGNTVATTTSDANGDYEFDNLFPGTFTVKEVIQAGWTITQPVNPPGTYTIPAAKGDYTGRDFGNFQLVTVSGNVYNDLNGNGQQNSGEPGLAGWTVNVVDAKGNVVSSAI